MGDGHFSSAGIDCSHTCLVLFSTHTAHIRAEGNPHTQTYSREHVIHTRDTLLDRLTVGKVT